MKLPEQIQPTVALEIGGKTRKLVFDFNAICIADELTGINLLEASVGSNVDAKTIRGLLFASLLHHDPTLTLEQVGSWITIKNIAHIRPAIAAAWFASIDVEGEDDPSGEAQAQPVSNG